MTADKSEILRLEPMMRAMYAALPGGYDLPGGICDMAGPARAAREFFFGKDVVPAEGAVGKAIEYLREDCAVCPDKDPSCEACAQRKALKLLGGE